MNIQVIQTLSRRTLALVAVVVLTFTSVFAVLQSSASALPQLTSRSATIDKPNTSSTNIQFLFGYTLITSGNVQSLTYNFCTTPLGTCTLPTGLDAKTASTQVGQTGFPANGTAFTPKNTSSDSNACLQSTGAGSGASFACYSRTAATAGNGAVTHTIAGVTGPTVAGTVYIRIVTYSDTAYLTAVDSGTVAVSFNQRLTINARVQESLTFCIGSGKTDAVGANGVAGGSNVNIPRNYLDAANVTDCSTMTGGDLDLGSITSTGTSISPVAASPNGGDGRNGYAMLSTNATNGAVVAYQAVQDTSGTTTGRLKVPSATCSGTSSLDASSGSNDQCFNSSSTQTVLSAGTEEYGMTIGGVSCYNVPNAASGGYTCDYTAGNVNLRPQTGYIGGTFVATTSGTYGTGTGFAWVSPGTATTIASSAASTIKVVSNEMLILKFGATAATTTPTGAYLTRADFIATPTF